MKTIVGFDCAASNMGVCYVEFDDKWRDKIAGYVKIVNKLYSDMEVLDKEQFIEEAMRVVKEVDVFVSNIIRIKFFNVVDLIPNFRVAKVPLLERTRRLKYLMRILDQQFDTPDVVLIEYQMKQNDISRAISHQIAYHYAECKSDILVEQRRSLSENVKSTKQLSNSITYAVDACPLLPVVVSESKTPDAVDIVGASLKNAYHFTSDGEYSNFIAKYSNYVANKKHTAYNFSKFIEVFGGSKKEDMLRINNKVDDIADSFMMIYGWLRKKGLM